MANYSSFQVYGITLIMEIVGDEEYKEESPEVLCRGRFYEKYMEKRESKLREEWFLTMEKKEKEIKDMWERLEQARSSSSTSEGKLRKSGALSRKQSKHERIESFPKEKNCTMKESNKRSLNRNSSYSSSITRNSTTNSSRPPTRKENRVPASKEIPHSSQKSLSVKSHHRRSTLSGPLDFKNLNLEKDLNSDCSKPFLRKGSGIGPGSGAAIAKLRSIKLLETPSDEESKFVINEKKDLDYNFDSGNSSSSHDSLDEILRESAHSSFSSGTESNDSHSKDQARERKKWGSVEKPVMFSSESPRDKGKGLKRLLLNFLGKGKDRESSMYESVLSF